MDTFNSDRVSYALVCTFLALTVLTIVATYYNTMVLRNFEIINDLSEEDLTEEEL